MGFKAMNEAARKRATNFKDTLTYIEENDVLRTARDKSIKDTRFFPADAELNLKTSQPKAGKIVVCKNDSFGYAKEIKRLHPECKVAVLNFASAYSAGGGVARGARAQEESLCRVSTLQPVIHTKELAELYYKPNKNRVCERQGLQTDALIYTPGIVICKDHDDAPAYLPERVSESDFVTVDVITCAAPDIRKNGRKDPTPMDISEEELMELHVSRAEHILSAANEMGVDVLVLGAFGCGVFKNSPNVVARAYKTVLEKYGTLFETIAFPIPGGANYEAFRRVLG